MHNDGKIDLFLKDIVETRIDAYHPIEREAGMDLENVVKKYGHKLCTIGNVNNKTTMVRGTTSDVEEEAKECLKIAAPKGGHILFSDHNLHDDIPMENIYTLIETGKKYGKCPIRL